jgi:hypothetical protein
LVAAAAASAAATNWVTWLLQTYGLEDDGCRHQLMQQVAAVQAAQPADLANDKCQLTILAVRQDKYLLI